jgi:hypothetical protein
MNKTRPTFQALAQRIYIYKWHSTITFLIQGSLKRINPSKYRGRYLKRSEYEKAKLQTSDFTISRRIELIKQVSFVVQLGETLSVLLTFVRYTQNNQVGEQCAYAKLYFLILQEKIFSL